LIISFPHGIVAPPEGVFSVNDEAYKLSSMKIPLFNFIPASLPAVSNGTLSLTSEVISPDNDGFEDVLQANYELTENGLLGKATIYDDRGRVIRELFKSELLGSKGNFSWDGTTDTQVKTSIGVYVLVFEAFSTNGGVFFTKKLALTVAGKL
jgi:hypothetical protein